MLQVLPGGQGRLGREDPAGRQTLGSTPLGRLLGKLRPKSQRGADCPGRAQCSKAMVPMESIPPSPSLLESYQKAPLTS